MNTKTLKAKIMSMSQETLHVKEELLLETLSADASDLTDTIVEDFISDEAFMDFIDEIGIAEWWLIVETIGTNEKGLFFCWAI